MNWYSTSIPIPTVKDSLTVRGITPNRAYLCRWPDYWPGVNQRVTPGLYLGDCRESLAGPAWSVSRLMETGLGGVVRVQELVCAEDVEWLPLLPVEQGVG